MVSVMVLTSAKELLEQCQTKNLAQARGAYPRNILGRFLQGFKGDWGDQATKHTHGGIPDGVIAVSGRSRRTQDRKNAGKAPGLDHQEFRPQTLDRPAAL